MFRVAFLIVVLVVCYGNSMLSGATCHPKYTAASSTHSQCITGNGADLIRELPPTAADITEILARHNKYRSETNATNMMAIKWNAEIAVSAQKLAAKCEGGHDADEERVEPGKYPVGQNEAFGDIGLLSSWTAVIDNWASEIVYFNNDTRQYSSASGHYSQVVWAESSLVGCGMAECNKEGSTKGLFYCNYAPAGNFIGDAAYGNDGEPCSACGTERCSDNLCDCGSDNELNTCMNMGRMNLSTCACSCRSAEYDPSRQCELTTCPTTDSQYLCEYYADFPEYCAYYSNFPIDCPVMCNTCPSINNGMSMDTPLDCSVKRCKCPSEYESFPKDCPVMCKISQAAATDYVIPEK